MFRDCLLGDVLTLKRGYDLPTRERRDGSVPIVSSSGISGAHSDAKIRGPGVVTGRYGTIGEVFYVPVDFWPLNTTLYVCDFKGNDPKFVSYFLRTLGFAQRSTAAAVPGVNRNHLHKLRVRCPDVGTQRRIASILSAYDDLIENNTRRIAILEEMARRSYEEWFVRFRFPGHEHVRMVESELGPVPEGWRVVPLASMVDTQYGFTESATTESVGPKFLRGMDINKQPYIEWSAVPYCPITDSELPKFKLNVGDVLVIRMADPGKVGIVEKRIDAVFASYLVRLRITDERLTPYYLFYFLTGDRYQGYITCASTGTTRKSASAPVITGISLVIPPASLIQRFEEQIGPLRLLLNNLLDSNTNLRTTRDLLLPRLISGELDVSALPEPEAVAA